MKLAVIKTVTHDSGLAATHNMPCAVCRTQHAVLDLPTGRFQPCWECQRKGWHTVKLGRFAQWLLGTGKYQR